MSYAGIEERAFLSRRRSHGVHWGREWWHPRQPIRRPMRVETVNPSVLVGLQVRVARFQLELNPWALQHLSRCGRVRSQSRGCCSCLPCHCSQLATFVTCCRWLRVSMYTVRADRTDVHRHLAPASPNDEACSHHGERAKYRRYLRRLYASTLFSSAAPQLAAPAVQQFAPAPVHFTRNTTYHTENELTCTISCELVHLRNPTCPAKPCKP